MYMRAKRSLVAPIIALSLAAVPAFSSAQNNSRMNDSTSYRSDNSMHGVGHSVGHSAGRVKAMQIIHDRDISQADLERILPLLHDLRDAKRACMAKHDAAYMHAMVGKMDKSEAQAAIQDCEKKLAERQRAIWETINDRIGSDKAMAFRGLAEPKTEDVSRMATTSVTIQRIDTLLKDLDRLAAERIAAQGGTDNSGVRQASVTTTTTTYETKPVWVTTSPAISEQELIDVVEERIVAEEIGSSDFLHFMPMHRDLNTTDITFLREEHMKVWW